MQFRDDTPAYLMMEMFAVAIWLPLTVVLIAAIALIAIIRTRSARFSDGWRFAAGLLVVTIAVPMVIVSVATAH